MKEMKTAQRKQHNLLKKIETRMTFYGEILRHESRGDRVESKMTFSRESIYQEIWTISLSNVAKKYDIPYQKLKEACIQANIPLPTQSYWGKLRAGKIIQREELPDSEIKTVSVDLSYRMTSEKIENQTDKDGEISGPEGSDTQDTLKRNEIRNDYGPVDNSKLPECQYEHLKEKYAHLIEELNFLTQEEKKEVIRTAAELRVDHETAKLHAILKKHQSAYRAWARLHPRDPYANWHNSRYRRQEGEPALWEHVSEKTLSRVYQILNPLFRAVEKLGDK